MGRLLVAIAAIIFFVSGCSELNDNDIDNYSSCPKIGGHEIEGYVCHVELVTVLSRHDDFCGLRVSTFGYAYKNWAGLRIYPDEVRATSEFIVSGLKISDESAADVLSTKFNNFSNGGGYVFLTGYFSCNDRLVEKSSSVGSFIEITSISVANEGGKIDGVRE